MSVIIVLIGVPASGKTTFSGILKEKLDNVHEICLDTLLPLTEQQHLSLNPDDDENFRKARKEVMFKALEEILKSDPEVKRTIVIDDNNYYSSMRYDYFRIAKENNVGFCQIHLTVPDVEVAVQRNTARRDPIPEPIIRRMYEKLEAPAPMVNHWESFSFAVDSDSISEPNQDAIVDTCRAVIQTACDNPPKIPEVPDHQSEGARAASRVVCNKNVLHQADKVLRKLLSTMIKDEMQKENPDMASVGQRMNSLKGEVLNDIKSNATDIPDNVVAAVESGDPDSLKLLEECLDGFLNMKLRTK